MSKSDRAKKRDRKRYAQPSAPGSWKRPTPGNVGANDNHVNDNTAPVTIRGVRLTENQQYRMRLAEDRIASDDLADQRLGHRMLEALQ